MPPTVGVLGSIGGVEVTTANQPHSRTEDTGFAAGSRWQGERETRSPVVHELFTRWWFTW